MVSGGFEPLIHRLLSACVASRRLPAWIGADRYGQNTRTERFGTACGPVWTSVDARSIPSGFPYDLKHSRAPKSTAVRNVAKRLEKALFDQPANGIPGGLIRGPVSTFHVSYGDNREGDDVVNQVQDQTPARYLRSNSITQFFLQAQ